MKALLLVLLVICKMDVDAQNADLQYNGLSRTQSTKHQINSRVQEFKEIGYLHQTSTDGVSWTGSDSSNQFTYDANGNLLSELIQKWNGTAWANSAYDSSVYINNNQALYLALSWDNTHNVWVNQSMDVYTYDSSNYLATDTNYLWSSGNSSWNYHSLEFYAYDSSGNLIDRTIQSWNNIAWGNKAQYVRTYDSLNLATSQLTLAWNNTVWDSTYLSYLNYDTYGDEVSTYFLALDTVSDKWNIYGYDTSTYEPINIQLTFLYLSWNADSGRYLPGYGYTLGYDEYGNNTSEIYYTYNDTTATNTNQWFYYYGTIDVLGLKPIAADNEFELYPNPASNLLSIEMNGQRADEIRLYDLTGQVVADIKSPGNNQVDVSQLTSGVYIAEVMANSNIHRSKWVKM